MAEAEVKSTKGQSLLGPSGLAGTRHVYRNSLAARLPPTPHPSPLSTPASGLRHPLGFISRFPKSQLRRSVGLGSGFAQWIRVGLGLLEKCSRFSKRDKALIIPVSVVSVDPLACDRLL